MESQAIKSWQDKVLNAINILETVTALVIANAANFVMLAALACTCALDRHLSIDLFSDTTCPCLFQ